MPGRQLTPGSYRYGFNGMEKDGEEWSGNAANQLDFGARIYDSRIGRFLSMDPLAKKYSFNTPYSFAFNNPVLMVDLLGLEGTVYIQVMTDKTGNPVIDKTTMAKVAADMRASYSNIGVDVEVQVVYSNDVLTYKEFTSREGAHVSDHYIILGSEDQLLNIDTDKTNGWDELYLNTVTKDPANPFLQKDVYRIQGRTSKNQNFSLINVKNTTKLSNFKSLVKKMSFLIQHEKGHRNFNNDPEINLPWPDNHQNGTYMEGEGATENDMIYTDEMKENLQETHNLIGPKLEGDYPEPILGPIKN